MKNKSFTLIELLVVIVIIGILAGVIMVSTSSSIGKANIAKSKVFEESVQNNLAANMVSRWKLDDKTGIGPYYTSDSWGSSVGTFGNGATSTTYPTLESESKCVSGKCMSFDGGDYIDCGNSSNLNIVRGISVSIWVKTFSLSTNGHIVSRYGSTGQQYSLYQATTGLILYINGGGSANALTAPNIFSLNNWIHIVGSFDNISKKQEVFINGISLANRTYNVEINNPNEKTIIGNCAFLDAFFNGLIDDVKIYNSALSSSQIKQNYIAGLDSLLSKESISEEDYNQRINALAYDEYE